MWRIFFSILVEIYQYVSWYICYTNGLSNKDTSVQFSHSVMSNLCDPMNHSTTGLSVHHQLSEFTQTHVHWVGDTIQPSHPVFPFSFCPQSFPASESFQMSQLFTWGGQSIGVSASTLVLPVNTPKLICFRMDWLDLLAVHGTLKSLL